MSVRVMTMVWDAPLPSTTKLVALKLADCANDDGASIWPSRRTIERQTGLGETAVKNALAQMDGAGLTIVVERGNGGRVRRTTIREFDMDRLADLAAGRSRFVVTDGTASIEAVDAGPGSPHAPGRHTPPVATRPRWGRHTPPVGSPRAPNPSLNHQSPVTSPPSPRKRGAGAAVDRRARRVEALMDALRAPGREAVIEHFIAPVCRRLRVDAPDAAAALGPVADAAAALPVTALAAARDRVLAERMATVKPADLDAAIAAERAKIDRDAALSVGDKIVTGTAGFRAAVAMVTALDPAEGRALSQMNVISKTRLDQLVAALQSARADSEAEAAQ